jgi:hypothetical protein
MEGTVYAPNTPDHQIWIHHCMNSIIITTKTTTIIIIIIIIIQ